MAPPDDEARAGGQRATQAAKAALAKKAAAPARPNGGDQAPAVPEQRKVIDLLNDPVQKEQIDKALPRGMEIERFTRICVTAIRANPQLQQCSSLSLLGACMQSAQLGLEPGTGLGHSYLVPFWNQRKGIHEVQFIIGYQGYIELFYRSDRVADVVAREVCENDRFKGAYGIQDILEHEIPDEERGSPKRYYGLVRLTGGGHVFHMMNLQDIWARRTRSKAGDSGPWQTDEIAMSRKTVIRAMVPYVPKTAMLGDAIVADESVPTTFSANMADELAAQPPIDVEGDEVPAEVGAGDGDPGPEEPPAS